MPNRHIDPQGATHSATPDSGSGTAGRPMLIMQSQPSHPPLGNQAHAGPVPPITSGQPMEPAQYIDYPMEQVVLIPLIRQRWST